MLVGGGDPTLSGPAAVGQLALAIRRPRAWAASRNKQPRSFAVGALPPSPSATTRRCSSGRRSAPAGSRSTKPRVTWLRYRHWRSTRDIRTWPGRARPPTRRQRRRPSSPRADERRDNGHWRTDLDARRAVRPHRSQRRLAAGGGTRTANAGAQRQRPRRGAFPSGRDRYRSAGKLRGRGRSGEGGDRDCGCRPRGARDRRCERAIATRPGHAGHTGRAASAGDRCPAIPKLAPILAGLPVAGFSGTLSGRFGGLAAAGAGVIRAKTGTLDGVAALAGYLQDDSGATLVFATIATGVGQDGDGRHRGGSRSTHRESADVSGVS